MDVGRRWIDDRHTIRHQALAALGGGEQPRPSPGRPLSLCLPPRANRRFAMPGLYARSAGRPDDVG